MPVVQIGHNFQCVFEYAQILIAMRFIAVVQKSFSVLDTVFGSWYNVNDKL